MRYIFLAGTGRFSSRKARLLMHMLFLIAMLVTVIYLMSCLSMQISFHHQETKAVLKVHRR